VTDTHSSEGIIVADRAALLISVDTFFESIPPVLYGAANVAELFRSLPDAGYNADKCYLLTGTQSTKAVIESHLHRLAKLIGKADSLLVLIVSRAFSLKNRGYLLCADTIANDLSGTSLAVADLVAALHKSRCSAITLLLDADSFTLPSEMMPSGLDDSELRRVLDESSACVALLSCEPGMRSLDSAQLKRGIWRHHLMEAFSGTDRAAVSADGVLTAAGLHAYLAGAVPCTVRTTFESSREQLPVLYGDSNTAIIIAELGAKKVGERDLLDPARMRRVVFRAESVGDVKHLAGFRKTHTLPERANAWARKYVNRIAAADIQADLDRTFDRLRDAFGYKRKDLEVSAERDGQGFIRTPDFEYSVGVTINTEDLSEVVWRREVCRLSDPAVVRSESFTTVFGTMFDRLVFEFALPVDVAGVVDRMEAAPPEGVKVHVESGAESAEIALAGFTGRVKLSREAVEIEGRAGDGAGLLDQFLAFLGKFAGAGEQQTLLAAL
jgi:hypothetical protein